MAIKAGNIVHVGNDTFLIDRIQTGGPGAVNIKRETVRELGNYQSVGTLVDIPDLSFTVDSYDVSCELEGLLLDADPTLTHTYDLSTSLPTNIKSAFKGGNNVASPFATVESVGIPYLILESMSYKFGIKTDASQTATLKGSEIYYGPGSTYIESAVGLGTVAGAFAVTNKIAAAGFATLTVASTAGLVANMAITVVGVDALLNGVQVITSVTGTTILFASAATIGTTACIGTATQSGQAITTLKPAYAVTEGGIVRRITSIGTKYRRLNLGTDYTETYGTVTSSAATTTAITAVPVATTDRIRIMYCSPTVESFIQSVHATVIGAVGTLNAAYSIAVTSIIAAANKLYNVNDMAIIDDGLATAEIVKITAVSGVLGTQTLTVTALTQNHLINATIATYLPTVKPAAIRGRDIDVYINGVKKISVQSVQVDWKVTLQPDEEFGNYHYIDQDFEVPDVTGTLVFKPRDPVELMGLMQQLSGVTDPLQSAPATNSPTIALVIALKNPIDGRVIKRLTIPDARFDLPGYSAKVLSKLDFTTKFTSDAGLLTVADS